MIKKSNLYPTIEECQHLWEVYGTPPHVIRHCKSVTEVAVRVALALNDFGYGLNIPLIQSAGLLHDLLRVEEEHGEHAAKVIEQLGYPDVADIVRIHMRYRIPRDAVMITETDLVCLGDRVVLEDRFVGLEQRMQYIIKKSNGIVDVENRIKSSFEDIRTFVSGIEHIVGKPIEELMK